MATVQVARKLVNPGRVKGKSKRKGKMPPALLAYWAAKKKKLGNSGSGSRAKKQVRATEKKYGYGSEEYNQALAKQRKKKVASNYRKYKREQTNPGEIITVALAGLNPGHKRKSTKSRSKVSNIMARRKRSTRRRTAVSNPARRRRVVRRRRAVVANPRRRARRNSSRRRTYARRRNGSARIRVYNGRRSRRRSNPGMLTGKASMIMGIIGGGALTKLIMDKLPASLTTGFIGYIVTGVVATLQGKLVGKLAKNSNLGTSMATGGYMLLGLKVLTDFTPSLAGYSPFGLRGLGMIGNSSFYVPQVPMGGSMSRFVTPAGVTSALPMPTQRGMGVLATRTARTGRMG